MVVQEELDGVLHWIAVLLILQLQWLYFTVPQSHVLSRMFYNHLTCHIIGLPKSPAIYILTPLYDLRLWIRCLNAWETISLLGLS